MCVYIMCLELIHGVEGCVCNELGGCVAGKHAERFSVDAHDGSTFGEVTFLKVYIEVTLIGDEFEAVQAVAQVSIGTPLG